MHDGRRLRGKDMASREECCCEDPTSRSICRVEVLASAR